MAVVRPAQKPRAQDIDDQAQHDGNSGWPRRSGFGAGDKIRATGLVSDEERNQSQDDRAGEASKITQLPVPNEKR